MLLKWMIERITDFVADVTEALMSFVPEDILEEMANEQEMRQLPLRTRSE